MSLAASGVTQSCHTEEVLQTVAFQLPSASESVPEWNTKQTNCKDVRMSVDAGGGKLKPFQQKSTMKQTSSSHVKNKKKKGNVGMIHWFNKYRDR